MEAFKNTGFDCEFANYTFDNSYIALLGGVMPDMVSDNYPFIPVGTYERCTKFCRPRLNDPQVLDNYDWVKEVDGAVWDVLFAGGYGKIELRNQTTENVLRSNLGDLTWLAYKGQQAGLGYDEWCKAHGVPLININ